MLAWIDELDRADRVTAGLLAAARRGSIVAFAIASVSAASAAMRRGRLAVAETEARTAVDLAVQHDLRFYEPFARALLAEALLERGEREQAARTVNGMDFEPMRGTGPYALLLHVRGRLRAEDGDRADAAEDLRECGEIYEQMGYRNPNIMPWRSALALVLPGAEEAHAQAAEELRRARHAGQPRAIGGALRALALLSSKHNRVALLAEAADILSRSHQRLNSPVP
jgi:hypothetical protein